VAGILQATVDIDRVRARLSGSRSWEDRTVHPGPADAAGW